MNYDVAAGQSRKVASAGKIRSYVFPFAAVPTAIMSAVFPPAATGSAAPVEPTSHLQYEAASPLGMDLDRRRILQGLSQYRSARFRRARRLRGRLVRRQARRPIVDSPDDIQAMLIDLD